MNECEYGMINDTKMNDTENKTKIVRWTQKPLVRQIMVSSCVCTSLFQMGLFFGACPVLVAQLRRDGGDAVMDDEKSSWISSTGTFSGTSCVLLLGLLGECWGRRPSYLFICVVTGTSFLVSYCATTFNTLVFALILQGPLIGGCTTVCLMIASEYVSPKYRGLFLSIHTATAYWGIWVANAVGTFFHWKNICIIGMACAVYNTLMMAICPESPFWLASKRKFIKCQKAHRWLRGTDENAEKELTCLIKCEMERSRKNEENTNFYQRFAFYINEILVTEFYKPVGLCILLTVIYHISGKYVISMYVIDIIKKITGSEEAAYTGMLMLDGITVLGMYIGSAVFRNTKRRTWFFSTDFSSIFFLFVLSLYLYLIKIGLIAEKVYLSISLLLAFSLCFSCGPFILAGLLVSEILPLKLRTFAGIVQCLLANIIGALSLKLAPWIFSSLGTHGVFLFFAIGSLGCALILLKHLPETKNKTLEQIESLFKENKKSLETKELVELTERACAKSNVNPSF